MHYTGTIWRPPYEAASLLLEVTAGCTHHQCKFCTLYDELPFPFKMTPLETIEADLNEVRAQLDAGILPAMPRTFLVGANPFVLKAERLLAIAELIHTKLPHTQTIGCFSRVTDVTLKTDQELCALQKAGYDSITLGIETGDDAALTFMRKGYLAQDVLTQCQRLDAAGIHYNFFYLTGISGAGRGETGALATAELCDQLHPQIIGASMLTVYPNSALYQDIQAGLWQEESEHEKYRELQTLANHLHIPVIFAALGASNAIPIQGLLPRDRDKISAQLERILEQVDEAELRHYRQTLRHL